ncbi:hypothetical protein Acr_24g0009090 [Actinidia rufa]|uniref:Cytochrome P450, family 716, subfamily A, polypeptide 1 n=1 Tax=Actinidia rufa TaxID=165716 RepID=A0A7J0GV43_9ERIC|nr:hypothetical protein Acr_24g0009090 [Actinidia rufa]
MGPKNLPRGSLGLPLIGETISFLKAQKKDRGPEWINERVSKYGQIFKTSLMGAPTVVIVGQAGNKFILGADGDVLAAKQPKTLSSIGGKHNIFELTGSRKRKEELSKGVVSPTSDVLAALLALRDENGEPITEEEIEDNFVTLMIASHDTSAILLSLMVWKMSRDKETYHEVLEEQIDILRNREGTEGKLTWADIQKMKYTWRVAQELMRMIPPVFGSFRKALQDTSFGGYDIPKGWQVFWVSVGTHMEKDIFENPMEFNPSRFNNASKPIPPYAYIPFGGGLHSCIGNEFARVETLTTIHKLVTMFEWSLVLHPDEAITRQPMPYPAMGLPIKVHPRIPL